MIYELRTTQVWPRTVPEYERRLEQALSARQRHARLAGCWHTEIGPLNQVLELWAYEDRQQYQQDVEARARDGGWPAVSGDLVQSIQVEMLYPAPFTRPLVGERQQLGPVYELRTYQIKTGGIPKVVELWAPLIPGRETLSPMGGCWYSEQGLWYHLWPYRDMGERNRIRDEAMHKGLWPPPTTELLLDQRSTILLPAACSPLQ